MEATVAGYYQPGDGGGGTFYWAGSSTCGAVDPNANALPDNGTVFAPAGTATAGRWVRVYSGDLHLEWFGARCDGTSFDDLPFAAALYAASRGAVGPFVNAVGAGTGYVGGTIVLPPGKTCALFYVNLGQIPLSYAMEPNGSASTSLWDWLQWPTGPTQYTAAWGIHIRGASTAAMAPSPNGGPPVPSPMSSTLLFTGSFGGACSPDGGGGLEFGANMHGNEIEDVIITQGPQRNDCLVNLSTSTGEVDLTRFHRVVMMGRSGTSVGVYMNNASYVTFDECQLGLMSTDIYGTGPGFNNLVITNSYFAGNGGAPVAGQYDILLPDVEGLHMTGNTFEYNPGGIYVGNMHGGDITGNWFNGEGTIPSGSAGTGLAWINVACNGCSITGNAFLGGGVNGIEVNNAPPAQAPTPCTGGADAGTSPCAQGGHIVGNHFFLDSDFLGGPIGVIGSDMTVADNVFESPGGGGPRVDIAVSSGFGNHIGPNSFNAADNHSVWLAPGTTGILLYDSVNDQTAGKLSDVSNGGWTKMWTGGDISLGRGAGVVLQGADGLCVRLYADGGALQSQALPSCP
jgi:hypothetical protein